MITGVTEAAQTTRYIPKVVPGVENLVLMEVQKNRKEWEDGVQKDHQSQKPDKTQRAFTVIIVTVIIIELMNW